MTRTALRYGCKNLVRLCYHPVKLWIATACPSGRSAHLVFRLVVGEEPPHRPFHLAQLGNLLPNPGLDVLRNGSDDQSGRVADRTREHLGYGDRSIVLFRKMLREQLEKVARQEDPLGVIRDPKANQLISFQVAQVDQATGGEIPIQDYDRRSFLTSIRDKIARRSEVYEVSDPLH